MPSEEAEILPSTDPDSINDHALHIFQALSEHLDRWQFVRITSSSGVELAPYLAGLAMLLRTFYFSDASDPNLQAASVSPTRQLQAPNLLRAELAGTLLLQLFSSHVCNKVTYLHFGESSVHDHTTIPPVWDDLAQFPSLISLTVRRAWFGDGPSDQPPREILRFECLQHFKYIVRSNKALAKLEYRNLITFATFGAFDDDFLSFCSQNSSKLVALSFKARPVLSDDVQAPEPIEPNVSDIRNILTSMDQLEVLELRLKWPRHAIYSRVFQAVVDVLCDLPGESSGPSAIACKNLKTVVVPWPTISTEKIIELATARGMLDRACLACVDCIWAKCRTKSLNCLNGVPSSYKVFSIVEVAQTE